MREQAPSALLLPRAKGVIHADPEHRRHVHNQAHGKKAYTGFDKLSE
jgi:hypothetical protein